MRSRVCLVTLLIFFCCPLFMPSTAWAAKASEGGLAPLSKSALLLDADTGTVLYEKNSRERLAPASITKIMTMLLVMEGIDSQKISYNDPVRVSERAASMGGSQIFLEPGETMKLNELLKGVAIGSANDASVALAEHISGTEEGFVAQMNKRAQELGMKDTHFQNPNGLSAPEHYSTAQDIAIMSRELLKYPAITKYTRIYEDHLRKGSKNPFWLVNTNRLVKFYQGMDGIKTGFTSEAKFCLSATAKRKNFRVIAVVMGAPNGKTRNQEITRMLNFAFSQYINHVVYKQGEKITTLHVDKGQQNRIIFRAPHQFSLVIKKGEDPKGYVKRMEWRKLKAPLKKGQPIGSIHVEKGGREVVRMDLAAGRDIPRAGTWTLMKRSLKWMFFLPEDVEPSEVNPS
ncbi:D-alanyl-D-alanine carboxypeptidase (penicillin-binding protein 5/6) [Marininema mesophilum]|uniref:serine-type D-Ala-D-Ala carboxypeptidase n=1 Tax=Marininema mesophilum TaxID=1048340 RepID=A0A1H2UI06_9BACL|nr:D-alanyl-D-alanine carboxypeptidase family protein [Marininema mesophilum]SDW55705.1 D-alanyl-D-alanine carboxypeptidase (penicillin-binding protein 5/6) [Marininema mesophilum]